VEHIFAFLVCIFIVIVFGLFSIFAVRNMYVSQSSFLQDEAVLAFRQLLENPGNYSRRPPTIGIAIKDLPYSINITNLYILKSQTFKSREDYEKNKTGLVSPDVDIRIILYNGTKYITLGANITRSKVVSVKGYAFCPPGRCLPDFSFCCPPNGNITVQVVVTGD
jgi:hypothetical protein